jgi:DNA-binding MarR family transcriptional regulator
MNQNKPQQSAPETSAASAWLSVVRTYQCCTRQYERMLAELGLTIAQFDVLVSIRRLGPEALPKHIADAMLVTRSNVTPVLQRLRQRGLVELTSHPEDGRARIAHLTEQGMSCLNQAMPAAKRFVTAQMQPFSQADLAETQRLMAAMHQHLLTLDPVVISHGPDGEPTS